MPATKADRLRATTLEAEGHRHHLVDRLRAMAIEAHLQADLVTIGENYDGRQLTWRLRAVEEARVLLDVATEAVDDARKAAS